MAKHENPNDFERYFQSLIERQAVSFPEGIVFPEKDLLTTAPTPRSLPDRLAGWWHDLVAGLRRPAPAVAYALVMALSYPAYLGLFQKPAVIEKTVEVPGPGPGPGADAGRPAFETAPDYFLGAGTQRDAAVTKEISLPAGVDRFILRFNVAVNPAAGARYDAQIRDATGAVVADYQDLQSGDLPGAFSVICRRSQLPGGGPYTLAVSQAGAQSGRPGEFRFIITPAAR